MLQATEWLQAKAQASVRATSASTVLLRTQQQPSHAAPMALVPAAQLRLWQMPP